MINAIVIGLGIGCIYGFIAMGFSLIYRTTGVMNFGQGAFVMLAGMGAGYSAAQWGFPFWAAALVGLACSLLGGAVLVFGIVLPLWRRKASEFITMLGTLLFLVAAENIVLNVMGSDPRSVPPLQPHFTVRGDQFRFDSQYIYILLAAIIGALVLGWFISRTPTGLAMRAVSTDRDVSQLMGVSPAKMAVVAFLLAALIGGIGGILVAPLQFAAWNIASLYNIKAFTAAVIGGVLDVRTAFLGGLVLGLAESFTATFASSTYLDLITLGLLLVILFFRPVGLFGRKVAVKY
ncbi:branched-chain amino acid ABC transporter permease [Mycetocola sp.]|uniref:branched-chain amino acid ABC transporter permease n=1 Tax=Mycetocola sp. TaxID=1871042 RepID=UPI00398A4A72